MGRVWFHVKSEWQKNPAIFTLCFLSFCGESWLNWLYQLQQWKEKVVKDLLFNSREIDLKFNPTFFLIYKKKGKFIINFKKLGKKGGKSSYPGKKWGKLKTSYDLQILRKTMNFIFGIASPFWRQTDLRNFPHCNWQKKGKMSLQILSINW